MDPTRTSSSSAQVSVGRAASGGGEDWAGECAALFSQTDSLEARAAIQGIRIEARQVKVARQRIVKCAVRDLVVRQFRGIIGQAVHQTGCIFLLTVIRTAVAARHL